MPSERNLHPADTRWDLAAESVAVQIRWFGLAAGFLLANVGTAADPRPTGVMIWSRDGSMPTA